MKKQIIFCFLTVAAFSPLAAENFIITPDEAVKMAVDNNLSLKNDAITLRTEKRKYNNSWNSFLPTIDASAGVGFSSTIFNFKNDRNFTFSDPGSTAVNAGLKINLPLNAGSAPAVLKLKKDYESGLLTYEAAEKKLRRDVLKQYYLILVNEESVRIQKSNIDLAQKRLDRAQNNYKNGLIPELDVLSAEVSLATLRPAYNQAQATYENSRMLLKFLLGADPDDEITLNGNLETNLYDIDSKTLISSHLNKRLDIRSLDKKISSLNHSLSALSLSKYLPSLVLEYNWTLTGSSATALQRAPQTPIDRWSDWQDKGTLSIGLRWSLHNLIPGSSGNTEVKNIRDQRNALINTRQASYEQAIIEVMSLVNSLNTTRETIEANTTSVELAKRTYEMTEKAYKVGSRELLDVQTQQQAYLSASLQYLSSTYQYIAGILNLEYALNSPIKELAE